MKVVIASDSLYPYSCGVSVNADGYIDALSDDEVTVVAPHHPGTEEYYKSVNVIRLPSVCIDRRRGYRVVMYLSRPHRKKLINILRASDVLVLESVTMLTILMLLLVKMHRIKIRVVFHLHTQDDEYVKSWFGTRKWLGPCKWIATRLVNLVVWLMARSSDRRICPSEHFREILRKRSHLKMEISVSETPVGLPAPTTKSVGLKAILGKTMPKGSKVLIFCGRLAREKNFEHLFQVFKEVYAEDPTVFLIIIGGGDVGEFSQIAEDICGEGSQNVIFTGNLARDLIAWLYRRLAELGTVLGVSSVPNETQGIALLEQMERGFAVCVLEGTCLAVVVSKSSGGFVIATDPLVWSETILDALNNPSQLEALGKSGQKYVSAHFSAEVLHKELRTILFE